MLGGGRVARHDRHAGGADELAGARLRPHPRNDRPGRAHKRQAGLRTPGGELRILGEKPVAGMDGIGPRAPRGVEQGRNVQVAVGGRRRTDPHGLVGLAHVGRVGVGVRVDRDGVEAE